MDDDSEKSLTERSLVDTSSDIKQRAAETSQEIGRQAEARAEVWREGIMEAADHVAKALDAAASSLRDDQAWLAEPAAKAARQIEKFATTCRDKSLSEMKSDAEDVARRNPALLMGGAIALGFAVSRLLKSAPPSTRPDYGRAQRSDTSAAIDRPGPDSGTARPDGAAGSPYAVRPDMPTGLPH